jgi:hypothetical protein
MRRALALLSWLAALPGCSSGGSGGPAEIDGAFTLLTPDNPNGEDDDPAVASDANGDLHVVWFSDRDGTKDLYYLRSTAIDLVSATIAWTPIEQITDLDPLDYPPPTQGDNFPALLVDGDGMVNVAWHRWNLANECHVHFLRSDGTAAGWASAAVRDVTTGAHFDRFPSLVRYAPDDLRIYFGSSTRRTFGVNDVFVCRSSDDGLSWSAPAAVDSLNDFDEQSQFPKVVKRSDTSYLATLDRWRIDTMADLFDPSSDVFYAESADGESWSVEQVSVDPLDDQNDITPTLFFDHAGTPFLAWATIAFGDPAADLVAVPVSARAAYPTSAQLLTAAPGVADHSPEVLALTVEGRQVFVVFWVRIVGGHNQVGYRVTSRP